LSKSENVLPNTEGKDYNALYDKIKSLGQWLHPFGPTIYALVRNRQLPCYKNGKKLYFFEDELLHWISKDKKKTLLEINAEVEADYKHSKGTRIWNG
jgi:hypothetical protein